MSFPSTVNAAMTRDLRNISRQLLPTVPRDFASKWAPRNSGGWWRRWFGETQPQRADDGVNVTTSLHGSAVRSGDLCRRPIGRSDSAESRAVPRHLTECEKTNRQVRDLRDPEFSGNVLSGGQTTLLLDAGAVDYTLGHFMPEMHTVL